MSNTEPRGVWENIKLILTGVADAAGHTTQAISSVAETAEILANTGKDMAINNRKLTKVKDDQHYEQEMEKLLKRVKNAKA